MATIVEIQESKLEQLTECAEKVVKYGKHLMECLEDVGSERYAERYGKKHSKHRSWEDEPYEKDYYRYN